MLRDYTQITLEMTDRIGVITLNRPKSLNALSSQLMAEVTHAMQVLTEDAGIDAIVLAGQGRAFSAGFDLKESALKNYTGIVEWSRVIRSDFDFIMQFWDCPKPTISAVQGHCLAGGLELAVACDITVADTTAIFGEPEVRFGSAIVALILPWIIGPKAAKEILLTGRDDISAERAYQLGIVNQLVEPGEHLSQAMKVARSISAASSLSVRMTKRAINRSLEVQGMRESLLAAIDAAVMVEAGLGPEREEFNRIRSADGLKAAIAWRNARGAPDDL